MLISINSRTTGKFRRETLNGRSHIVTSMMPIRGNTAMNGLFYPLDEVKKSFMQLNKLPAPNGHPKVNGVHISAFDPIAMNAHNVGAFIRNPKMKGKEVYTDVLIDETVANLSDDGREIIKRIEEGGQIGVSTGLAINQVSDESGTDELGASYSKTGYGFNFDHVAILLNEKPAGAHAGTEMILNTDNPDEPIFVVNVATGTESVISINLDGDNKVTPEQIKELITQVNESIDEGEIEFVQHNNSEDQEMDKSLLVQLIIANALNAFTSEDKDRLTAMNESDLVGALCVEVDVDAAREVMTTNGYDFEGYENFTANKDQFEAFQKSENERLDEIREGITTNSEYTPELLEGKTETELLVINKMITDGGQAKRVAEGGAPIVNNGSSADDSEYLM